MRITWREQAESDLNEAFDYVFESNPGAARRIYETIRQKVELLRLQPSLGRPGRVHNTRELVITRTPYIVAYTVDTRAQAVIVLRVLHGAQLWPATFDEA